MKIIVVVLLIAVVLLFFPNFELVSVQKGFSQKESLSTVEKGFLSRETCREKAKQLKLENFQCRKIKIWENVFSGYLKYNYKPPGSDQSNEQNSGQD